MTVDERKPRIIVLTGDGKGKTTSGFGSCFRATGQGIPVSIVQFVKSRIDTGEFKAADCHGQMTITCCGMGFVPAKDSPEYARHRVAAEQGLSLVRDIFARGGKECVLLDEICVAIDKGLLSVDDVIAIVKTATPESIVILTGRNAPDELIELADTVTEMRYIKHLLDTGGGAQVGVEL